MYTCLGYISRYTGSFKKDLNDNNTFPWGIPHYHCSNMAYNTFEHISSLNLECAKLLQLRPLGGRLTSCKMAANGEETAFCVLQFHMSRSVLTVQREFRTRFQKEPPAKNSIRSRYDKFQWTGCLCKGKSPGRPSTWGNFGRNLTVLST